MSARSVAATASFALLLAAVIVGQESRRTIWDGVFTAEQAARGEHAYAQSCATCHAEDLLGGGNAPALVGDPFFAKFNQSTADDVVQTIRQTMPQEAPGSLPVEAYVDIASYLFKANGGPAGAAELPAVRAQLQQVIVTAKEVR